MAARLRGALRDAGYRVMDPDPQPYWQKLMFKVNAEDWTGQKLDVTTWEDEMSFLSWIVTAVTWLGNVLVTVLMVIVAVGIMNTLAIAIRERTREIGTLRAIGMQRTPGAAPHAPRGLPARARRGAASARCSAPRWARA